MTWDPRARQPSARAVLCRGEAMAPVKPYSALAVSFKAFWRESRMAREPAKCNIACLEVPWSALGNFTSAPLRP